MRDNRIDEQLNRDYKEQHNQLTSVLEMNDLEAFMHEASMRGTSFEAEKGTNVVIVTQSFGTAAKLSKEQRLL